MGKAFVFHWIAADGQPWDYHLVPPVTHWPSQLSEAQVTAMHAEGPDRAARGGFAAFAQWLQLVNPPFRATPMGGAGQPTPWR